MSQKLGHHANLHRMMRFMHIIWGVKCKKGFEEEFGIRSTCITTMLVAEMYDKLRIEAGAMSYIPQYARKPKAELKEVAAQFGRDTKNLIEEVEALRCAMIDDTDIRGYSMHAKSLYAMHIYLDLVNAIYHKNNVRIIDGYEVQLLEAEKNFEVEFGEETYTVEAGDQYAIHDGDTMSLGHFYAYLVRVAEYRHETLVAARYEGIEVRTAIEEICKHIREQKGISVYYKSFNGEE